MASVDCTRATYPSVCFEVHVFLGSHDYLEQSDGLVGILLLHRYTGAGLTNGWL